MNGKLTFKKAQILLALTQMLAQPYAARISTAALAAHLHQSESSLYRHFSSKAAIFTALIDSIESLLFEDLTHIEATEPDGRKRLRKQLHALLLFTERHPGLTRVLTGDALVNEDPELQTRLNTLIASIEALLCRNAQHAADTHTWPANTDACAYARLLMDWVLGRWLRYAQTAWQEAPTAGCAGQLDLLGL